MYPYKPWGKFRHPEGWTAFNAALNVGLAYMGWFDTAIKVKGGEREITEVIYDKTLTLTLQAPRNFDLDKIEKALLRVISADGKVVNIEMTEEAANGLLFKAQIILSKSQKSGAITLPVGKAITFEYGVKPFSRTLKISPQ